MGHGEEPMPCALRSPERGTPSSVSCFGGGSQDGLRFPFETRQKRIPSKKGTDPFRRGSWKAEVRTSGGYGPAFHRSFMAKLVLPLVKLATISGVH